MITNTMDNLITSIWPMLIIFIVSIGLVRIFYLKNANRKFVFYQEFIKLLFLIYLLLLFELVTNTETGSYGYNLKIFSEIFRYEIGSKLFFKNIIGNVLLFIPFGFFVGNYIKSKKGLSVVFIAGITSITIELVQYRIGRAMDIDDVILNVIGAFVGFLLYKLLNSIRKKLPQFMRKDWFYNVICILLFVIIVYYILMKYGIWCF